MKNANGQIFLWVLLAMAISHAPWPIIFSVTSSIENISFDGSYQKNVVRENRMLRLTRRVMETRLDDG